MTLYLDLAALDAHREQVRRTSNDARAFRDRLTYGAQGIIGETGELVECIKKCHHTDFHQRMQITPADISNEAGDVVWYAVYLLNLFDVATERIDWPARDASMPDDVVCRAQDCSLVLGIEAGAVAWLARQHLTHRLLMTRSTLAAAISRHCGALLYTLAWLLDCYGLTLQQAMEASVAKSAVRFPVEVEVGA